MAKFRKKPVIIEAIQWNGSNIDDISKFLGDQFGLNLNNEKYIKEFGLRIKTLEGIMKANINDFIIKGIEGEFYPCKPDIFKKTYEKVN